VAGGEGQVKLHLIDAFADAPFTGNPAGVVLLDRAQPDEWMQSVAMEMNQAETAFLRRQEDGYALRWFTPAAEVDLCGHATLASAHYLWEEGHLARDEAARFHTRSGWLIARCDDAGWITLDFPGIVSRPSEPSLDVAAIIGTAPLETLMGDFDVLCILPSAAAVRALTPDLRALARLDVRGVIVTAPGDVSGIDFVSRCFFPRFGVAEDPVTGSAHCALAMYWRNVLGRETMIGYQASPRGGTVRCTVAGDRVELTGRAVTTLMGDLQV
jgi:PhzF family phenazine biosynthesis protein